MYLGNVYVYDLLENGETMSDGGYDSNECLSTLARAD